MSEGQEIKITIGGIDLFDHKEKVDNAIQKLGIAAKSAGETFRGFIDAAGTLKEDKRVYYKNGLPYLKFRRIRK